jgi:sortase A
MDDPAVNEPTRRSGPMLVVLDVVGRTMIATGAMMLMFVAYQLWGTGLAESRSQDDLGARFESIVSTPPASSVPTTVPAHGDVVSRIEIPSIGVDKFVVAGVDAKSLQKGPGLFPGSPLAGQLGNVAITGHRTTYGAPFSRIDELGPGDEVIVQTPSGEFTYIVDAEPFVVEPSRVEVARTTDPNSAVLTLISCHPRWTSEKRIVVTAVLESDVEPAEPTVVVTDDAAEVPAALSEGWFHDPSAWPAVAGLFALLVAAYVGTIIVVRRGVRAFVAYPVMVVALSPVIFVFFGQLSRLLPTNL